MSGTRNTSTRIVLEGEAEYRAALKNFGQFHAEIAPAAVRANACSVAAGPGRKQTGGYGDMGLHAP